VYGRAGTAINNNNIIIHEVQILRTIYSNAPTFHTLYHEMNATIETATTLIKVPQSTKYAAERITRSSKMCLVKILQSSKTRRHMELKTINPHGGILQKANAKSEQKATSDYDADSFGVVTASFSDVTAAGSSLMLPLASVAAAVAESGLETSLLGMSLVASDDDGSDRFCCGKSGSFSMFANSNSYSEIIYLNQHSLNTHQCTTL